MKRKGFTLIELLIVVAIIAILAAIAVPNFLESQTRAKVSRVMADMRSIATAIEAYTVDYNTHPPDWQDVVRMTGPNWPAEQILTPLTTPVAYLTSLPQDSFFRRHEGFGRFFWVYMTSTGYGSAGYPGHNDPTDPAALFYGPRRNYRWVLDSVGPDMSWECGRAIRPQEWHWAGDVIYYDATNGTKSQGDIYYHGPGGGINPHPVTCR